MRNVSGGKGGFWSRKFSFFSAAFGSLSTSNSAVLCSVTGSSSFSDLTPRHGAQWDTRSVRRGGRSLGPA